MHGYDPGEIGIVIGQSGSVEERHRGGGIEGSDLFMGPAAGWHRDEWRQKLQAAPDRTPVGLLVVPQVDTDMVGEGGEIAEGLQVKLRVTQ